MEIPRPEFFSSSFNGTTIFLTLNCMYPTEEQTEFISIFQNFISLFFLAIECFNFVEFSNLIFSKYFEHLNVRGYIIIFIFCLIHVHLERSVKMLRWLIFVFKNTSRCVIDNVKYPNLKDLYTKKNRHFQYKVQKKKNGKDYIQKEFGSDISVYCYVCTLFNRG